MSMADRIRYLVKRHPKSRKEIAGELYISIDSLGNYITGRRCPDAVMIRKLALYFHVSADFILGITDEQETALALPTIPQEQQLLHLFRSMDSHQREYFFQSGYGIAHFQALHQQSQK